MPRQTPPSVQAEAILREHFPGLRFGRYNCRPISGSSIFSQHSWNNALDIWETVEVLDEVNKFLGRHLHDLNIRVRLWRVRNHYNHIHIDFWPKGIGVPHCRNGQLSTYQYLSAHKTHVSTLITTFKPETEEEQMIQRGDRGNAVALYQKALLKWRPGVLPSGADGVFGQETETGVLAYQKAANVERTGKLDGVTAALLSRYVSKVEHVVDGAALEHATAAHTRLDKLREV